MAMLNPMMTTDVAGNPCWMRPGGWTQVGILKTRGCMGSVVKPHKWLLLKRPWEFVKELFRTYLALSVFVFSAYSVQAQHLTPGIPAGTVLTSVSPIVLDGSHDLVIRNVRGSNPNGSCIQIKN